MEGALPGLEREVRRALDGLSNATPEIEALARPSMVLGDLPFDPLEYVEHLDDLPFDPDMDPSIER